MNDGQLNIKEIQIDKNLFRVNTIDLHISKVLIRPEQADMTQGKNVIIHDKRIIIADEKILSHKVPLGEGVYKDQSEGSCTWGASS
jgi:hypothetical protein